MGYSWLEHTSELALRIEAPSETAVFELAAAALGELLSASPQNGSTADAAGGQGGEGSVTRRVSARAPDRAALLAAFLEELVYLVETDDLVPERAENVELGAASLTATVRGRTGRPRHLVKGVTYSDLTFERCGEHFTATVVLDV